MSELTDCCNSSSTSDTQADGSAVRLLLDLYGFTCSSGKTVQYILHELNLEMPVFMWMINIRVFARHEVLIALCQRSLIVWDTTPGSLMSGFGGFEGKCYLDY